MGFDHRIGPQFLKSGIGFGGFCFPKDLQAFVWIANQNGYDFQLLREVEKINMAQIETFLQKLRNEVWVLGGKTIAAWGLAFKPNTDDLRFSPALAVIEKLVEQGAKIRAYDPKGMEEARKEMPALTYCSSALEAAEGADALLVLTEWPEFKAVDLAALRSKMTRPLIIDGRNLFDAQTVRSAGFEYASMGRP
jgi:UDPglucose 6-dehydrogenase